MNRRVASAFFAFLLISATGAMAQREQNIPVYGNYQGEISGSGFDGKSIRAEVIGESGQDYRAQVFIGDGSDEQKLIAKGRTNRGVTPVEGDGELGGSVKITGQVAKGEFTGEIKGDGKEGKFTLKRVLIQSPTLGEKPPEGAVVLFDGTPESLEANWEIRPHWMAHGDGSFSIVHSSIVTKQNFGDALYHIEFMTPYMPNERGQARGNSGVYVAGRYEVQVLDNFGDPPADNHCGGIYSQSVPLVNACLPPLEWQTYDIEYYAPKFDDRGNKTKNAVITVKHNGTVIHDKLELTKSTPGGTATLESPEGKLLLQDHSDIPRWRNIWIKPLNN